MVILRDTSDLTRMYVSNDFTMTPTTRVCYGRYGDGKRLDNTDRQRCLIYWVGNMAQVRFFESNEVSDIEFLKSELLRIT